MEMQRYPAGTANPYYVRFSQVLPLTVIDDAVLKTSYILFLWIGNNDVLSYATSGGSGTNQTGNLNPATYGANDISDPNVVAGAIKAGLDKLKATEQQKELLPIFQCNFNSFLYNGSLQSFDAPAALGSNITTLNTSLYGP
jgi:hypothetical protein